ncbi:hypothetical protein C5749_10995 [Sphingobacterium gobiense]|uniref:Thioredoxin domain-containing protein n=2 Tax=Sphingobacterium gobiense TaxID=1382456 RepID=A0A2S9JLZ7_9SPHI|nr:hypothetical protein C5749_10995 [Sphingobacterium gobiense]
MKIILIFTIILFYPYLTCYAQDSALYTDGYTSLEIKFKGEVPVSKDMSNIQGGNMLSYDRPLNVARINDSTYHISFYTFGPSPVYFTYRNTYFTTVLLPDETDILEIYHQDTVNFELRYTGQYKEIFDQSKLIAEKIGDMLFSYEQPRFPEDKRIESAEVVKDSYLRQIQEIQRGMDGSSATRSVMTYVKKMPFLVKTIELLKRYDQRVLAHNKNLGFDSLQALNSISHKEDSFYQGIVNTLNTNVDIVWPLGYRELVETILADPHAKARPIEEVGLSKYKQNLVKRFNTIIENENSIFYDMALAIAYLEKISNGSPLTEHERMEITRYYQNKAIVNYLFHVNELNSKLDSSFNNRKYFLPFEENEEEILKKILTRYHGKYIVVDFWATWCGPCLDALARMKPIKEQYANRNDFVFIYITNESSEKAKWNDLIKTIGGEHYFLYSEQSEKIMEPLDIQFLPSYLFFTKEGMLKYSHLDGYVGNTKFSETLEDLTN